MTMPPCATRAMRQLGVAACRALIPVLTTMAAVPQTAPVGANRQQVAMVAMAFHGARPGKADAVCRQRLHASDVRARRGFPRGRVP